MSLATVTPNEVVALGPGGSLPVPVLIVAVVVIVIVGVVLFVRRRGSGS
jgi:hypothetical protein